MGVRWLEVQGGEWKMGQEKSQGLDRGVELIFTGGHISLVVAFKGLNVILGLYKCNYSLTRGKELSTATGRNKVPGRIK